MIWCNSVHCFALNHAVSCPHSETDPSANLLIFFPALQKKPEDINRRSADMWSFAVLLWELVTREVPFADLSHMEIGMKVSSDGNIYLLRAYPETLPLVSFPLLLRWPWKVCVPQSLLGFHLISVSWCGSAWTKTQPRDRSLTWSFPSWRRCKTNKCF